ncbi:11646_t:CDS:2, partial [Diversispora eburnea]
AEEKILEKKCKANIKDSKVEERVNSDNQSEKRQRITRSMSKQKAESFTDLITDNEQTPSVAPSTVETEVIVESNKKLLQDLLGVKCSENIQLICQYHDKTYSDEILLDLSPNSRFSKELPLDILSPYLKELDDKIENLIPSHVHEFLTQFFKQNLIGKDWHTKIEDLQCQDHDDVLMVSVIRILRRTLPLFKESSFEFGDAGKTALKQFYTADKYQLVYVEGSRLHADDDKEIADASKIANNLQKIYINVVKDNIKCRRRFPKLYIFGRQSFRLRIYLQFLDYCVGGFEESRTQKRPSRLSYINSLKVVDAM